MITTRSRVFRLIEKQWTGSGAWLDFKDFMHQTLRPLKTPAPGGRKDPARWIELPGLCCQAAGGDARWADHVAAAWLLFYLAAHIIDKIEDSDEPDAWWGHLGPGVALNVASGLYFTASHLLTSLIENQMTRSSAPTVVTQLYEGFLTMCGGQHRDLITPTPNLEEYWEITGLKSGVFFSMACQAGACLAGAKLGVYHSYGEFGRQLGILIQILDDLEDLLPLQSGEVTKVKAGIKRSLAVVYASEVLPSEEKTHLFEKINAASSQVQACQEVWQILEDCGAALFLTTEIELHRNRALTALHQVAPLSPAGEVLSSFIHKLARLPS